MTGKKKPVSSTDSSTESSSGSSSSSSSATGSNSSSSSDSDSSSSQESTRNSSNESGKKTASVQKSPRKSTDNSKPTSAAKPEQKSAGRKGQTGKSATKTQQKPAVSADSTEDEEDRPKQVKRKSNVKPKASATINPKQPASGHSSTQKSSNQKPAGGKTVPTSKGAATKAKEVNRPKNKGTSKVIDPKKKSIFSPENSSDSEGVKPANKGPSKSALQAKPKPEPRPKAAAKPVEKARTEKKKEDSPEKKSADESTASSVTSTTGTSSSSETESSADDSENDRKVPVKKPVKKPSIVTKENGAGSESEADSNKKQVTRKLTRSASTRKSKHVLGKNQYSDSDSESESTKRSLSRSPVKRAPGTTKGKTKNNKKNDAKSKINEVVFVERQCPLEGCDSMGHLSGKFDKHFVLEACPTYHNVTIAKCKSELTERKKREEQRSKALEQFGKSPRNNSQDHKQYLTKIRDLRAKFKQEKEPVEDIKPTINKNKEPNLNNFVPEYDLKLFRDAQALASEKIEEELKMLPSTKGTKSIEMGKFEMEVWYQSPYPEDYARLPKLYICEFCLRYMKSRTILERHVIKCVWKHPPGDEVYRKDKVSVWEVDGKKYKQYCQNLCLLAKFFLDHKTLYYDVEPFLFYIMTLHDNEGCHTVGYFSKEKNSFLNYNVSCILTLPPYQRQGYGRLLIDFSYLLTRVEGKIGSPEKPLSDLGLISYRSYWKDVLLNYLCSRAGTTLSVKDISQEMAIHSYDIVSTLQALGMMKYWKGKHIILKKQDVLDEYVERGQKRASQQKEIDPTCLRWIPPQSQTSV